jgi:hypothetical protein
MKPLGRRFPNERPLEPTIVARPSADDQRENQFIPLSSALPMKTFYDG